MRRVFSRLAWRFSGGSGIDRGRDNFLAQRFACPAPSKVIVFDLQLIARVNTRVNHEIRFWCGQQRGLPAACDTLRCGACDQKIRNQYKFMTPVLSLQFALPKIFIVDMQYTAAILTNIYHDYFNYYFYVF